jgi:hypothetical protein
MVKQADAVAVSRNLRRFIFVILLRRIGMALPRRFAATPQRPATRCKHATREIYAGIFTIQFPPTKNTILSTPERNCLPDFSRRTESISLASAIQRNSSITSGNAPRSPNPRGVSSGISFSLTGSIEFYRS